MDKVLRSDVLLRERPALRKGALLRLTMPEEGAVRETRRAGQARYRMALSAPGGRGAGQGKDVFRENCGANGCSFRKAHRPPAREGESSAAAQRCCGLALRYREGEKAVSEKARGRILGSKACGKGGDIEPRPGRNEKQRQSRCFRVSKKWRNATFSSFHRFCLSHQLPGGKTCKVRKPQGFHPF